MCNPITCRFPQNLLKLVPLLLSLLRLQSKRYYFRHRRSDYNSKDVQPDRRYRSGESRYNSETQIDKKKLLEIARRNAIQMMKSGSLPGALTLGPQAQEKVLAAIRAGGKTVEELTDFCKTLSQKEELGELSSNSEGEEPQETAFHHPFQISARPTSIVMNIKVSEGLDYNLV